MAYYKMLSEQFGSGGSSGREACAKWCLLLLFCHIIITTNLTHTSLIYSTPANHYFLSPTYLSRKVKYEDDGVWSYIAFSFNLNFPIQSTFFLRSLCWMKQNFLTRPLLLSLTCLEKFPVLDRRNLDHPTIDYKPELWSLYSSLPASHTTVSEPDSWPPSSVGDGGTVL